MMNEEKNVVCFCYTEAENVVCESQILLRNAKTAVSFESCLFCLFQEYDHNCNDKKNVVL